ncbi:MULTISPECIES: hypothetical protein [Paenibacillus]|nr:hypothetical protein [Paenibacillus odorifer]OMC65804.1 hypothetical protein BK121_21285 [Paenibacillus odorifer]OMC77417.1 hypothetical protein BK125_12790 [Paenibacillus odorifer]OMD97936.1 hypothetical protein BSK67_01350 [Paenibacillus odorifer]OME09167.1 hypothetical protein BSK64_01360 [Paenibacillus odorifer]
MKKKYRSAFIAAYILTILAGVIWHAGGVSAQDTIKLTVNSHTTSTATMNNMQPGDETNSEYTIINAGSEGFNYYVDFKFISGDAELYDILQMTLEKEGVIIYSGVMSEAAGRVAIGSLAGGEQSVIQMDVIFPWEAGNEYQGKTTTVAFEFSASGGPEPSAQPSPSPTASATAQPTPEPSPTATATPTVAPTTTPTATATATPEASPTATASPTTTATSPTATAAATPGQSTTPTPSPIPTASPVVDEISVTEAPIPLGGGDNEPTASPSAGSQTTSATPQPSNEIALPDDELPLGAPEVGNKLPNTAEPWYNLILASLAIAVLSVIIMRRLKSKK